MSYALIQLRKEGEKYYTFMIYGSQDEQARNSERLKGPTTWLLVLDKTALRVYRTGEAEESNVVTVVARDLTTREVYDQVQVYMHMLEGQE